jgi:hypothetical protein
MKRAFIVRLLFEKLDGQIAERRIGLIVQRRGVDFSELQLARQIAIDVAAALRERP